MVTVTLGFDDVGLLRFADVSIAQFGRSTLVQALGDLSFGGLPLHA